MRVRGKPWAERHCAIAMAVARGVSATRWDDRMVNLEFLCTAGPALAFESQRFTGRRVEMGLGRGEVSRVGNWSIGRSGYLRGVLLDGLWGGLVQARQVFRALDNHYALIKRQGRHLGLCKSVQRKRRDRTHGDSTHPGNTVHTLHFTHLENRPHSDAKPLALSYKNTLHRRIEI